MSWDLIVIGGGPGGYTAAIRAAQLGLRTALVEREAVGGTCLNRGCIPTKALIHAAERYEEMKECATFGLRAEGVSFDYPAMCARRDQVVGQLREGVERLLKGNKVDRFTGTAQILGPGRVRVGEEVLEGTNILIATGSRPVLPPVPGLDLPGVLTSDDLLTGDGFYPRLAIIGGGVIGMEFAGLYQALGAEVTVLEAMDRVLPTLDREISQSLSMLMKKKGVKLCTGARVERVERGSDGLVCTYTVKDRTESVTTDAVLVAAGRRANTDGLCVPEVDLGLERGAIPVDDRFQTCVPGIYAIGDVVKGSIQLAHAAAAQGTNAVSMLAGKEPPMDLSVVPSCVYVRPEVACVGHTEAQCKEAGIPVKTAKYLTGSNSRSVITDAGRGFIKVVYHGESSVILGAQLLCERATDLVGEFASAISRGASLEDMAHVIRAHPTFAEGIGEAVEVGLGLSIHQLSR